MLFRSPNSSCDVSSLLCKTKVLALPPPRTPNSGLTGKQVSLGGELFNFSSGGGMVHFAEFQDSDVVKREEWRKGDRQIECIQFHVEYESCLWMSAIS